ncbi:hypothetical protein DGWBC_0898 [Dehalogenimonas sp. WBC-2]|nr:hypothetical protein DGWBC_0898 [Dehalogenimonas sp. WBC-2]
MRIMVDIGHPAHVHFYKNFIREMEKKGHEILVTARDKDVAVHLLKAYGIKHTVIGKIRPGKLNLIREWIGRDLSIYAIARKFRPDILTGIGNPCAAHVARLIGAKSIIFNDSECGGLGNSITHPFANVICTPACFNKELGKKQVRYNGYHELAYLHPNYFKPDPTVLEELGLNENDKLIIMRFVAWGANHDVGQHGFNMQYKKRLVEELNKYGRVIITSETPLPQEFEQYKMTVSPEKILDLMYYATLLIGDTQTMTTEAAVLGTPAIRYNSFVGPNDMSNFIELENKYGLIYSVCDPDQAISKAVELLQMTDLKPIWKERKDRLIQNKIDVTQFMMNYFEAAAGNSFRGSAGS